jgi:hypothetical protein
MLFLSPRLKPILAVLVTLSVTYSAYLGDALAQSNTGTKVSTIEEILSERQFRPIVKRPRYCQGGVFKPCVCPKDVPSVVQYRPAVKECDGAAAIVLSGRYKSIFSVVVRDRENKDRWPPQGINNCTAYQRDILALHKCSAFKAQKVIDVDDSRGDASVHCLGASGSSTLFKRVVRMTAKLADIPNSTADPLARWCLVKPDQPLN